MPPPRTTRFDPDRLATLSVADLQAEFAAGTATAESVAEASLERIARLNPSLNAIVFLNPDALADARAIDRRRAAGETLGPLAGIPVVVKDPMDMRGLPTTAGWAQLHGPSGGTELVPATDAPVVARLRASGAVILGKTNVPVLSASGSHANDSWAGPTRNAVAPGLMPGGSSAGTATAVASGMVVLGLAEETGGSIQNPASAQGLVGIKPTFALVPNTGVVPLSGLRDVVGPIARRVRDAALCLDIIAGPTPGDPKTEAAVGRIPDGGYTSRLRPGALEGRRLGLYGPGWRDQPVSAETAALYDQARALLERCGATLVADPFAGSGFAALRASVSEHVTFDARGMESLPNDIDRYLERLGPDRAIRDFAAFAVATRAGDPFAPNATLGFMHLMPGFAEGLADPAVTPDMSGFLAARGAYLEIFDRVMADHRLDALVFPQMRAEVPPLFSGLAIEETTVSEINIAGLPGVTIPAGRHASGAPFGVIFVGPLWSEAELLALAYDFERAVSGIPIASATSATQAADPRDRNAAV